MKKRHFWALWLNSLSLYLFFGLFIPTFTAFSLPNIQIVQNMEEYDRLMDLGYQAVRDKNYLEALAYFKKALATRPGDGNAQTAIANLERYLQEGEEFHVTPRGVGAPNERVGAGSRQDGCLKEERLVAIIPENRLGLTSQPKPTLLFNIPSTTASSLVLRLKEEGSETMLYERTLTTPKKPGFAQLDFNEFMDAPALELNKIYHWRLTLQCDPDDRSGDVTVSGAIKRVEIDPAFTSQLEQSSEGERARLYAVNGLWYDAVKALSQARQSDPQNAELTKYWSELFNSENLN